MDHPQTLSKSRTLKFHKLFKTVPENEYPVDYFSCAYIGDILLQGNLYVSQNWFCFYSRIRGRGRLLEIPMDSVISITREKTALIFPNAIGLQTKNDKFQFGSFMSRDSTYKFLVSMWKKSQEAKLLCEKYIFIENFKCSDGIDGGCDTLKAVRSSSSFGDGLYGYRGSSYDTALSNGDLDASLPSHSLSNSKSDSISNSDSSICIDTGSLDASDANEPEGLDMSGKTDSNSSPSHNLVMNTLRLQQHQQQQQQRSTSREKKPSRARKKVNEGRRLQFPYSVMHCIDREKTIHAFQKSALKLQKIPRTNLLLAVCTFLVLFLVMSAFGLTYKILDLEAKLSDRSVWTDLDHQSSSERTYSSILNIESTLRQSTTQHMQNIMKANLKLLEEINSNLQDLKNTHDRLRAESMCPSEQQCN